MDNGYVLCFDVGTTSIKAGIINLRDFRVEDRAISRAEVATPRRGWAEVDPGGLWNTVVDLAMSLSENVLYNKVSV